MIWTLSICGASSFFLAWLWWKERRGVRLLASILAIASLAAWGIPLYRTSPEVAQPKEATAIMLTDGYDADSLRAFQAAQGQRKLSVYNMASYIRSGPTAPRNLELFGYGLSRAEWASLPPVDIVFHPSLIPSGITAVSWPPETGQGEAFVLSGHFHQSLVRGEVRAASHNGPCRILLAGPGSVITDSAIFSGTGDTDFVLKAIPGEQGRVVYSLILLAGRDTLENNPVPFSVRGPHRWSALILSSGPDFENKFLGQWLEDNGHRVAIRTAISKGKYATAFGNEPSVPLQTLPFSFLDSVDILIADPAALSALPPETFSHIREQVRVGNMGLIIRTDSALPATWIPVLKVVTATDTIASPVSLIIPGNGRSALLAAQLIRPTAYLSYREGAKPLLIDSHSHVWACSTILGSGKVVVTTLSSAYHWMLPGDTTDYAAYWSLLLSEAAGGRDSRDKQEAGSWTVQPSMPFVRNPVMISLLSVQSDEAWQTPAGDTGIPKAPFGQVAGTDIQLRRSGVLPFLWQGVYWPLQPGWQAGIHPDGQTGWWYAYQPGDWKTIQHVGSEKDTKEYPFHPGAGMASARFQRAFPETLLPYFYFILFLVSIGFLWAAKKAREPGRVFPK